MLRPRRTTDAAGTATRLDGLQDAVRREAEGAEADPFDEAMVAAVTGALDALKAEAGVLAEAEAWMARTAKRAARSG